MIILDTNVISALMQEPRDDRIVQWVDEHAATTLWLSVITVYELRFGIEILDNSRRRERLERAFDSMLNVGFAGRVFDLDTEASRIAAAIAGDRKRVGRAVDLRDTLIAGIAISHHTELATRNTRHFAGLGLNVINPWSI